MYTNTQPNRVQVINDTGLYRGRQSYDQLVTVVVDETHRIRISIHRDTSYDFQSRFLADRWNGNEWREIAHVPALSARGTAMPRSVGANGLEAGGAVHDAVDSLIDHLIFDLVIPTVAD